VAFDKSRLLSVSPLRVIEGRIGGEIAIEKKGGRLRRAIPDPWGVSSKNQRRNKKYKHNQSNWPNTGVPWRQGKRRIKRAHEDCSSLRTKIVLSSLFTSGSRALLASSKERS